MSLVQRIAKQYLAAEEPDWAKGQKFKHKTPKGETTDVAWGSLTPEEQAGYKQKAEEAEKGKDEKPEKDEGDKKPPKGIGKGKGMKVSKPEAENLLKSLGYQVDRWDDDDMQPYLDALALVPESALANEDAVWDWFNTASEEEVDALDEGVREVLQDLLPSLSNDNDEVQGWLKDKAKGGKKAMLQQNLRRAYLTGAGPEVADMLNSMLALLRAQAWAYQTTHWQIGGNSFYGNHLLFSRLYEGLGDQIDGFAEKMVGYLGVQAVDPIRSLDITRAWIDRWAALECPFKRGLLAEEDFQTVTKRLKQALDDAGALTLGMDDWLAATASAHETHTYLLQQVLDRTVVDHHDKKAAMVNWHADDVLQVEPVPPKLKRIYPASNIKGREKVMATGSGASDKPGVHEGILGGGQEVTFYGWQVVNLGRMAGDKGDKVQVLNENGRKVWVTKETLKGPDAKKYKPIKDKGDGDEKPKEDEDKPDKKDEKPKATKLDAEQVEDVISKVKGLPWQNEWHAKNVLQTLMKDGPPKDENDLIDRLSGMIDDWNNANDEKSQMKSTAADYMIDSAADVMKALEKHTSKKASLSQRLAHQWFATEENSSDSGAPSAEGLFFDNPENREVREFADSHAITNIKDVAEDAAKEDMLDESLSQELKDVRETPPTPEQIDREPGNEAVSTLYRYIVETEEKVPASVPTSHAEVPKHPVLASWTFVGQD